MVCHNSYVPSIQGFTERKLTKHNEQFDTLYKWFEKEATVLFYLLQLVWQCFICHIYYRSIVFIVTALFIKGIFFSKIKVIMQKD